jgi:hypothetical protein
LVSDKDIVTHSLTANILQFRSIVTALLISFFEGRMFSRWILTNITSAGVTLHCRKTLIPCGDQLVICGKYPASLRLMLCLLRLGLPSFHFVSDFQLKTFYAVIGLIRDTNRVRVDFIYCHRIGNIGSMSATITDTLLYIYVTYLCQWIARLRVTAEGDVERAAAMTRPNTQCVCRDRCCCNAMSRYGHDKLGHLQSPYNNRMQIIDGLSAL